MNNRITSTGHFGTGITYTASTKNYIQKTRMYFGTIVVVTDKEIVLSEVFAKFKRVKLGEEEIYIDEEAKMPYTIYTCKLYSDAKNFTSYSLSKHGMNHNYIPTPISNLVASGGLETTEDDMMTLKLAEVTNIKEVLDFGTSLRHVGILNLLSFIGVSLEMLPFNYKDTSEIILIEASIISNSEVVKDIYKIYENYFNADKEGFKRVIASSNYLNLNSSTPYACCILFNNTDTICLEYVDDKYSNLHDYIKELIEDPDRFMKLMIKRAKTGIYGMNAYSIIEQIFEGDQELKEFSYNYLDKVNLSLLTALLSDFFPNREYYFNQNKLTRQKLLSNNDISVKRLIMKYLKCMPIDFECVSSGLLSIERTELYRKLSPSARSIYHLINTEDIVAKIGFPDILKIIANLEQGYDKSSLLLILAKIFVTICYGSSTSLVKQVKNCLRYMEYMFTEEDLKEFAEYYTVQLSEYCSEDYAHVLDTMYENLYSEKEVGFLFEELFGLITKMKKYRVYKLEKSLIK